HSGLWPAAFVRQAAKGDRVLPFWSNKKHLRFFQWSRKIPPTSHSHPGAYAGPGSKNRQRHPSAGGMKDKDSEIEGISVN
ncbi:hypothetical protein HMPREF1548_06915, partial [Clostridium sp. KLE 1755]